MTSGSPRMCIIAGDKLEREGGITRQHPVMPCPQTSDQGVGAAVGTLTPSSTSI